MPLFAEILTQLPPIDHIEAIEIIAPSGAVEQIENRPGRAGSVAVYNALLAEYGVLNRAAASKGIELFGEHSADARSHPGSHPNIDRLLQVIETDSSYELRVVSS